MLLSADAVEGTAGAGRTHDEREALAAQAVAPVGRSRVCGRSISSEFWAESVRLSRTKMLSHPEDLRAEATYRDDGDVKPEGISLTWRIGANAPTRAPPSRPTGTSGTRTTRTITKYGGTGDRPRRWTSTGRPGIRTGSRRTGTGCAWARPRPTRSGCRSGRGTRTALGDRSQTSSPSTRPCPSPTTCTSPLAPRSTQKASGSDTGVWSSGQAGRSDRYDQLFDGEVYLGDLAAILFTVASPPPEEALRGHLPGMHGQATAQSRSSGSAGGASKV